MYVRDGRNGRTVTVGKSILETFPSLKEAKFIQLIFITTNNVRCIPRHYEFKDHEE